VQRIGGFRSLGVDTLGMGTTARNGVESVYPTVFCCTVVVLCTCASKTAMPYRHASTNRMNQDMNQQRFGVLLSIFRGVSCLRTPVEQRIYAPLSELLRSQLVNKGRAQNTPPYDHWNLGVLPVLFPWRTDFETRKMVRRWWQE